MSAERVLLRENQLYNERQHLKYPIPYPLEVKPIGKTLTAEEWKKFCKYLTPKLQRECERRRDGTINFHGEGGLAVAKLFQERFKDRFHLRMICADKIRAIEGLQLAHEQGLSIHDVHFKNERNEKRMLNDEEQISKLLTGES